MAQPQALDDISSLAWEHPLDAAALQSLRRIPGFDLALRRVFGLIAERTIRLMYLGSAVEVGPDQYPRIHDIYTEVLNTLDAPERYQLFISQSPIVNAGAIGMDKPFIVLQSGLVKLMDDNELRYVIGHELGHIMSGHVLYKTMLSLLLRLGRLAWSNPLSGLAWLGVMAGLMEWDRKSELSADRAGLLAVQDPAEVRRALLMMAGGMEEGASVEAFQEQARRYEEDGDALDSVAKTLSLLGQTHPFPVQRLKELDRWIESGSLESILEGDYPRRQDDPHDRPTTWSLWRESMGGYADGVKTTTEPVTTWVKGVGQTAAQTAGAVWGKLKGRSGDSEAQEEWGQEDETKEDDGAN